MAAEGYIISHCLTQFLNLWSLLHILVCEWCATPCSQTPGSLCRGTAGEARNRLLNDSMNETKKKEKNICETNKLVEEKGRLRLREGCMEPQRDKSIGSCILLKLVAMAGHKSTRQSLFQHTQKHKLQKYQSKLELWFLCLENVGHFWYWFFVTRLYLDSELDYFYWAFMDTSKDTKHFIFTWKVNELSPVWVFIFIHVHVDMSLS